MSTVKNLILSEPPIATGASAVYPWSRQLEKRFTLTSRFDDTYLLYARENGHIHLPRAVCPVGTDQRVTGKPVSFTNKIVPRTQDQARLFDETVDFLKDGESGIVEAPTGSGKTVCALNAIAAIGCKTLVVVTKSDLMQQWIAEAKQFLGLADSEIGVIQQGTCDVTGRKLCIGMIHSLAKDKYPDWIKQEFGLVVYDETHRLPAETFSRVAWMFPAKLRLGLSATPERADGKEVVFLAHIGPIRARGKIQQMVPKVLRFSSDWTCPRKTTKDAWGMVRTERVPHQAGKTGHILKSLCKDTERNALIVKLAKAAWKKGRRTVLFSDLIDDHLRPLHDLLIKTGIPGGDIGWYISGLGEKRLDKAKGRPLILATYGMMSEATNVPWLDTCILATPRANVNQPVGRIRREYPDKPEPVVMDIVDRDSPVFQGYAEKRLWWYRSIGCHIETKN